MQKKCLDQLPEGYRGVRKIDLQNDKKLTIPLNVGALLVGVVFFLLGMWFVPLSNFFNYTDLKIYFLRVAVLLVAMIGYLFLHEMVHGLFIYLFGAKPYFGFTGLYAYAGTKSFFRKREYLIIALAPVVVWGIILAVVCVFLPAAWFWPIYMAQVMNLSGSVGDLYVTWTLCRMPRNILIRDTGVAMTVFARFRTPAAAPRPAQTQDQ